MKIFLESPRLLLRQFEIADAPEMLLLNSDLEVIQFTGDNLFNNIEEAEQLIRNYDQYRNYRMGRLTVILKNTNEYLGWCGLKYNEDIKEVDLGFRFHKKYWGRGYATEAAIACLNYGFEKLKLKRIIGRALKENIASIRVLEKAGMKPESEKLLHGKPAAVYSIEKLPKPVLENF